MKVLISGLLVLFAGIQSQAATVIQSASNINNGKFVVAVDVSDPARRVFMELDARTGRKESLGFPNDLVSEDIMAVISLPDYVVVLSRWTSADGRKPKVHEYVRSSKIWMAAGDLNCLSFDQIEIEKSELRVQCADENKEGLAIGPVKMALDFTAKSSVKVSLPIQEASQGAVEFALKGGSMFKWASMDVKSGKSKKSYTAEDLSLSSEAKIKKTIKVKETIGPAQ